MFANSQLGFVALISSACASGSAAPKVETPAIPAMTIAPAIESPDKPPREAQRWTYSLPAKSVLRAAAMDREGDLVIAPTLVGKGHLGEQEVSAGLTLIKLKSDGSLRWSKPLSGNAESIVRAIEVSDEGDYVIAGTFAAELRIDETRLQSKGDRDAFVAVFSPEGDLRWARALGGLAREQAITLAISDEARQITIGGWAESSFRFAGQDYNARGTAKDGFIATYDFTGKPKWAHRYRGVGSDQVRSLAYDADELTVVGSFSEALQFGDQTARSKGMLDIFCARYEAEGGLRWHKSWGSTKDDLPIDIEIAESGRTQVVGVVEGDIAMGGRDWPTIGESDILLWSMDLRGEVEQSQRLGGSGAEYATDAEAGASLTLAGYYSGPGQFAQISLPVPLKERAFLVRLDTDFSVIDATDLDYDRLLFTKERFGGQLRVGLWRGAVKLEYQAP